MVSIFIIVSLTPAVGQSIETGWVVVDSGTEVDLNAAVVHGSELWAFGDEGVMLSSSDGGLTWQTEVSPITSDFIAADAEYDSMAVLGADGAVLFKEGTGGEWQDLGIPAEGMASIAVTSSDSIITVGAGGAIWQYSEASWADRQSGFSDDLNDVAFLDSDFGIACGESGSLIFTDDGGATWDYREAPEGARDSNLVSAGYYNPFRMFAISSTGQILASTSQGGHIWNLVEIESQNYATSLSRNLNSIDVASASIILFTGPSNYLAVSLDGGNIVSKSILPEGVSTSFNDFAMVDYKTGVAVGDGGVILWTDDSGKDQLIGFEIPDYNNFGEFAEYADDMLLGGFLATIKIVGFGILFGFFIGTVLALFKTAPNSLKKIFERYSLTTVKTLGGVLSISGFYLLMTGGSRFGALGLDGIEYIYTPVGDPRGFGIFVLGLAMAAVGVQFVLADQKLTGPLFKIRPLNSIATVYTDFFRNTPLIVQFMFIHFGVGIGLKIQKAYEGNFGDMGTDGLDYFFFGQSAFISAIFTLGLNSGAYQCETIRGAIAAIPTGQMEAGRSIGLTYMGTMRLVILPQAIRICIPPLGNEMVNLVLNSSLAMVIGYAELARQGRLIIAVTFQIFWAWGMVMISYFVITWTLALLLRRLEEKTKIPGLGITGGD